MNYSAILSREFINEIQREVNKAREKFPSGEHNLAALVEEVGELHRALLQQAQEPEKGKTHEDVWGEALQVAAMATRVASEGDPAFPKYHPESGYRGTNWEGYKEN